MSRQLYPVSVKAAIFNADNDVLMIHMPRSEEYGMPGGHIDAGETPDEAMARELLEEAGIACNLTRADFFFHEEGKLILAYVGKVQDATLKSNQDELEGIPVWVSKEDFTEVRTNQCYKEFLAKFWA